MINYLLSKFKQLALRSHRKAEEIPARSEYLDKLDEITAEAARLGKPEAKLRVLYGPSFAVFPPCYVHDRLFSTALQLRGCEIIPLYCDAVQDRECNYFGGTWMAGALRDNCKSCMKSSKNLWSFADNQPLLFSRYLTDEDRQQAVRLLDSLAPDAWADYAEDGFALGSWAKDILVNNYTVADYRRIDDHEALGKAHLRNLWLLRRVYERIFDEVKPDRAVANDSYYGMWAIIEEICRKRKIPFYSHWLGGRQDGWCYASGAPAMGLDFSKSWKTYSAMPLDERRRNKALEWLRGRSDGKLMILDTASIRQDQTDAFDPAAMGGKPAALLVANVIWDLAALNKQVVFAGMMEWIIETIRWFGEHPEYNLIVKPHPAELHPSIPATEERVCSVLEERGVRIPPNVTVLTPKVNSSVYDIMPFCAVGLVHTTTVGFEMAAHGFPVITSALSPYRGLGFTLDAETPAGYFQMLEGVLSGGQTVHQEEMMDLALKFILFYQYHYYSKIDIMHFKWGHDPVLKIKSARELLPGQTNPCLEYFLHAVVEGLPILSEDRWPPES